MRKADGGAESSLVYGVQKIAGGIENRPPDEYARTGTGIKDLGRSAYGERTQREIGKLRRQQGVREHAAVGSSKV